MTQSLILCGKYLAPGGHLETGCVTVEGAQISETAAAGSSELPLPPGAVILPGFIDLQINGAFGVDVTEDPTPAIQTLSHRLPERGVVAFLPTVITSPVTGYPAMLSGVDLTPAPNGAVPLGLHLEGPFINIERKGAHNPAYICLPAPEDVQRLIDPEKVRIISLAPEMPGGLDAIRAVRAAGILPATAHSMATYQQACEAFAAGAGYGIHLFNAMPPLHHREPGLIGALLEPSAPPFGIIPDGIHIHPAVMGLIFRSRGVEGITLISDAMAAAGLGIGDHKLGDREIRVDKTSARLHDGTLAGSIILSDDAVRNMVRFGICDLPSAARMVSETPARVLGIDDRKGKIAPGYDADLVVLDEDLQVYLTIIGGEVAYQRESN